MFNEIMVPNTLSTQQYMLKRFAALTSRNHLQT